MNSYSSTIFAPSSMNGRCSVLGVWRLGGLAGVCHLHTPSCWTLNVLFWYWFSQLLALVENENLNSFSRMGDFFGKDLLPLNTSISEPKSLDQGTAVEAYQRPKARSLLTLVQTFRNPVPAWFYILDILTYKHLHKHMQSEMKVHEHLFTHENVCPYPQPMVAPNMGSGNSSQICCLSVYLSLYTNWHQVWWGSWNCERSRMQWVTSFHNEFKAGPYTSKRRSNIFLAKSNWWSGLVLSGTGLMFVTFQKSRNSRSCHWRASKPQNHDNSI